MTNEIKNRIAVKTTSVKLWVWGVAQIIFIVERIIGDIDGPTLVSNTKDICGYLIAANIAQKFIPPITGKISEWFSKLRKNKSNGTGRSR